MIIRVSRGTDRRLGRPEACVCCGRSGVDDLLPTVPARERPKPYRPRGEPLAGGKAGTLGRGKAKGRPLE
jgi:hypothetical protein